MKRHHKPHKGNIASNLTTLPMFPDEMRRLGWDELDVLLVTGDAYVDHPAFGMAMIGRYL